jgi:hypothetical protein
MRPGVLQAQVQWRNAFRLANGGGETVSDCPTNGSLTNKGHSGLRLWPTDRTRIVAESQGKGGFSLADSQSFEVMFGRYLRKRAFVSREAGSDSMGCLNSTSRFVVCQPAIQDCIEMLL